MHAPNSAKGRSAALIAIKLAHTVVWALLAGCVLAIPVASLRGDHRVAAWLSAIVAAEVVVLCLNHGRCPLTVLAARFTDDRREDFDICLPVWLARHNKLIIGVLYFAGRVFALALDAGRKLTIARRLPCSKVARLIGDPRRGMNRPRLGVWIAISSG